MLRNRILAMVVGAALFTPALAAAQSAPGPSSRQMELAQKIMDETGMTSNMETMLRNMFGQISQQALVQASPEMRQRGTALADAMTAAMIKVLPVGHSMVQKMPVLMQHITSQTLQLMPEIQRSMATELCARDLCTPALKAKAEPAA